MENATFLIDFNIPNWFDRQILVFNSNLLIGEYFPSSLQIIRVYMFI